MGTYPNFEVNKYEQNYIPLFYSSRGRLWERLGPIGGGRQCGKGTDDVSDHEAVKV